MLIKSAHQLRGCMEYFGTANPVWEILAAPVDELVTFGDENNEWAARPQVETWHGFWYSMSVIETCMATYSSWRALFRGS